MLKTFSLGLAIVISPCTYFLLPLVFTLATNTKQRSHALAKFTIGFLISTIIIYATASLIKTLLIYNFIKLVLGILFISLGVYTIYRPISGNMYVSNSKNLLVVGVLIPIISSLSGCGLPFLATLSTIAAKNIIHMVLFALGMLSPYMLIFILGKAFTNFLRKFINKTHSMWHKLTSILFLLLGFYTLLTAGFFSQHDLYILLIAIILMFAFLCYKQCYNSKRRITKTLLASISFIFWTITITSCKNFALFRKGPLENIQLLHNFITTSPHTCSSGLNFCPYCITCSIIFLLTTSITTYVYITATTNENTKK